MAVRACTYGFQRPTPWAQFLPLIGDMMVLAAPSMGADADLFPGNAVNNPSSSSTAAVIHCIPRM